MSSWIPGLLVSTFHVRNCSYLEWKRRDRNALYQCLCHQCEGSLPFCIYTVPFLVIARSHMWLFNFVHSRDLPFPAACSPQRELVVPCFWQRLACTWKESCQTVGLHCSFVKVKDWVSTPRQCPACVVLVRNDVYDNRRNEYAIHKSSLLNWWKLQKGGVMWSWHLVWECVLPPVETNNEDQLNFSSASNTVKGERKGGPWWAVSAILV